MQKFRHSPDEIYNEGASNKYLLEHTGFHWVRYTAYEWKINKNNVLYLTTAQGAKPEIYDPIKDAQTLVINALNNGRLCMSKKQDNEIQKAIAGFASKYGLFGLMTALPITPNFMKYEAVYLPKNSFIREKSMHTEQNISLFYYIFQLPDRFCSSAIWR